MSFGAIRVREVCRKLRGAIGSLLILRVCGWGLMNFEV